MKKIYSILFIFLLAGCSRSTDELLKSDEELVYEEGAIAFIVRIDSINDVIEGFYLDGTVPKTIFNATCIVSLEGECTQNIILTRYGGEINNDFVGVKNEFIGYPEYIELDEDSIEYNLFEIDNFYLVLVQEEEEEFQTLNMYHLSDYNETLEWNNQGPHSHKIIFAFQDNLRTYREYIEKQE